MSEGQRRVFKSYMDKGGDYTPEIKNKPGGVRDILLQEFRAGHMGSFIVDVGSGIQQANQLSRTLHSAEEIMSLDLSSKMKFVQFDFLFPKFKKIEQGILEVPLDMRDIGTEGPALITALDQIATSLKLDVHVPKGAEWQDTEIVNKFLSEIAIVDSMIFSDILNYTDFKTLLSLAKLFLKEHGRMYIFNSDVGLPNAVHPSHSSTSEKEVQDFLVKDMDMKIIGEPSILSYTVGDYGVTQARNSPNNFPQNLHFWRWYIQVEKS